MLWSETVLVWSRKENVMDSRYEQFSVLVPERLKRAVMYSIALGQRCIYGKMLSLSPEHHGYKTQHSTVTALHTVNNTVAKAFKQMAPPARTITVALDMTKAFDTINIHTLIRKLLQTKIPGTINKFITKYK